MSTRSPSRGCGTFPEPRISTGCEHKGYSFAGEASTGGKESGLRLHVHHMGRGMGGDNSSGLCRWLLEASELQRLRSQRQNRRGN